MSGGADVVRFHGVTKRFGDFVAVGALDLAVRRGVVFGVLGPNGAGKTTALRMLNDIIAPDDGRIALFGDLAPGREAGRRIGYLPEERGLYPKMKVVDLLVFFAELRGLDRRAAGRRSAALLERLGLRDWQDNRVQDLSKGMQQKVQFAAALVHEPELLVLDEPWSGLDPINADVLRDVVREQRALGKTILFSTHLMEQAEKICDDLVIIARGRKVAGGELAAVKRAGAPERTVAIGFADDGARAAAAAVLADEALVAGHADDGGLVRVELAAALPADEAARRLLAALVGAGVALRRFEIVEPTLHDVFVRTVGQGATTEVAGRLVHG